MLYVQRWWSRTRRSKGPDKYISSLLWLFFCPAGKVPSFTTVDWSSPKWRLSGRFHRTHPAPDAAARFCLQFQVLLFGCKQPQRILREADSSHGADNGRKYDLHCDSAPRKNSRTHQPKNHDQVRAAFCGSACVGTSGLHWDKDGGFRIRTQACCALPDELIRLAQGSKSRRAHEASLHSTRNKLPWPLTLEIAGGALLGAPERFRP